VNAQMEPWRLKWSRRVSIYRPVVADSYNFEAEHDPGNNVKGETRVRIKVMLIRNHDGTDFPKIGFGFLAVSMPRI
jgi:hypothetical protein